jgi:hypothetical protein
MNLKPPRRLRETFQLLAMYDDEAGLPPLLDQIDWRGVTPRQIYAAFLDRLPESAAVAAVPDDYVPRNHAEGAITSQEFRDNVVTRLLAAFPEKRRLLSVFVPYTADADLRARLSADNAWVDKDFADGALFPREALFAHLRRFARYTTLSENVLVTGFSLSHLISAGLYRFGDRLFCVVRHPFELVLGACYEILALLQRAGPGEETHPALAPWLEILGRDRLETDASREEIRRLCVRMLSAPGMLRGDTLCHAIGEGNADSAMELMARCELEIVPLQRYAAWLEQEWEIEAEGPPLRLPGPLQMDDLGPKLWRLLSDLCAEDVRLWEKIGQDEARRVRRRANAAA